MPLEIDRNTVQSMMRTSAQLVEALPEAEYAALHIPNAINIPLKTLNRAAAKRLDSRRPLITYCHDYQ